jgi:endonuclease YncB( thermonuclease family)
MAFMFASGTRCSFRRRVASALAGGLALGSVALHPSARPAPGPSLNGTARVIDGDTLDIHGERVRLEGIDAPELAQACGRRRGGTWRCGEAAASALRRLIAARAIVCQRQGRDKYGRTLGVCFADGHDINAEMVREGLAWAFVRYSRTYVREEAQAREERVGVWQGAAEAPWDFRAKRWAGAEIGAPRGCAIKGNVSAHGRIYHMPWSPWYGEVKIEAAKGERWFCSEAEALAAGWRPVAVH